MKWNMFAVRMLGTAVAELGMFAVTCMIDAGEPTWVLPLSFSFFFFMVANASLAGDVDARRARQRDLVDARKLLDGAALDPGRGSAYRAIVR